MTRVTTVCTLSVAEGAVSVTSLNAKEESLQTSESSTQSVRFHQPPPPPPPPQDTHVDGRHTGALLSTAGLLQHDGLRDHGRRKTGYDITTPVSLAARPGTSILKLNVVDEVGDLPTVVVPGKLLALELHSGNISKSSALVSLWFLPHRTCSDNIVLKFNSKF